MGALSWKPILSNLAEARGEVVKLYWRLHWKEFGGLPEMSEAEKMGPVLVDWRNKDEDEAWFAKMETKNPIDEVSLFISMEHAYHHLNWAWNCRRTPEDRVWHFRDSDADRWTRFPDTTEFADLWPSNRAIKEHCDKLRRKISLCPVRIHVQMVAVKLNTLCYLVAKELGEDVVRPKNLNPEIGIMPLAEKEFTRRMHRIYSELNMAWNSRKDKTFVVGKCAISRRERFPSVFATGSHNMWRQKRGKVL